MTLNSPPTAAVQLRRRDPLQGRGHRPRGRRPIDCAKVKVTYILGHDSHGHPITSANGCTGTIKTTADGGHDPNANIFGVFDAEYTDGGGGGQAPLTSHDQASAPARATGRPSTSPPPPGIKRYDKAAAHGGKTVGDIDNGDWISFKPYNLTGVHQAHRPGRLRRSGGGTLEVRTGLADRHPARLRRRCRSPAAGRPSRTSTYRCGPCPRRTTELFLVFKGGQGDLYDVDDFELTTG